MWPDLDATVSRPRRLRPLAVQMADLLRPYRAAAMCGLLAGGAFLTLMVAERSAPRSCPTSPDPEDPERCRLPAAGHNQIIGCIVAIVDDTVSADTAVHSSAVRCAPPTRQLQAERMLARFRAKWGVRACTDAVHRVCRGSCRRKQAPSPAGPVQVSVPECALAMPRAMARPSPLPSVRRECVPSSRAKRSKMRSRSAGGTPGPCPRSLEMTM